MARYRVVPERSWVDIHARSNVHPIHVRTSGLEGDVDLDVSDTGVVGTRSPAAGRVTLRVERLVSGNPLQDRELRRRIDARRFPTIDGEVTGLHRVDDEGRYRVAGDVTFRGVTRSYEEAMRFTTAGDGLLEMEGRATFDIRDFGMAPPRVLMLKVEPEVEVTAHIVARREPPA
jgi:polyisoprenoid-binding protein YceI